MMKDRLIYIESLLFWMSCSSNYGDYSEEEYKLLMDEYIMNLTETEMIRLYGLMQELCNSKLRVKAEAGWKKEAINAFIEEIGSERMNKKQVNLLFKFYMLQEDNKLAEEIDSQEDMVRLVEKLTNKQLF